MITSDLLLARINEIAQTALIIVNIDLIDDLNDPPEIIESFKTMIRPETNGLMRTPKGVTYRTHEIIYDYSKVVTMMTKTTGNVIAWCTCSIAPGFE